MRLPHKRRAAPAVLALAMSNACAAPPVDDGASAPDNGPPPTPTARRIVSLIPAATEILFAFDAGDRLVGRTRWGIHPAEARSVPDVGDGMRPSLEAILAREPDLVILYDGAANAGVAERLESLGIRSLALRHDTLGDLDRNIAMLGAVSGCEAGARRLTSWIAEGLHGVRSAVGTRPRVRVYYDAWADPPITIGRGSFLDSLLTLAGADNVFGDLTASGPRVSLEALLRRDPDWVLTSAPRDSLDVDPELDRRTGWDRLPAVREGRVAVVDRDLVGRLGPRVAEATREIAEALHGGLPASHRDPWVPGCTA